MRMDLFGSVTKDPFDEGSDVDILVEFGREGGRLFDRYFDLKEEL